MIESFEKHKTKLNISVELPSLEAIKRLVARGVGLALVPKITARAEVAAGLLKEISVKEMKLESDSMAFSEEIKIEVLRNPKLRFGEISIMYSARLGEIKLNPWRDGIQNMWFLAKKRFFR